jgi:hypothetical protein
MSGTYSSGPYSARPARADGFTVEYSQPLFFELDYLVTEGYRRIPHGGIEIGGLLFGVIAENTIRVQEFRLIECEHASGPSFQLSEKDLTRLREQIAAVPNDPELANLQLVGWFVAHTRSELQLNDSEIALFNELFPGAGKFTLLVKPEKFKATRFVFLPRDKAGDFQRNGTEDAFVLPLPGRAASPESKPHASPPPSAPAPSHIEGLTSAPPEPPSSPRQHEIPLPQPESREIVTRLPVADPVPSIQRSIAQQEVLETGRTRTREQADVPREAPGFDTAYEARRRRRSRAVELRQQAPPLTEPTPTRGSRLQFMLVLLIAAALGCGVGYWAYLQLPPPVIPLAVRDQRSTIAVSWPPEQTREAVYAAIRVDDAQPVLLSTDDRSSGSTNLRIDGDAIKVELIVRHWLRDSRGIVHYLRANTQAGQNRSKR